MLAFLVFCVELSLILIAVMVILPLTAPLSLQTHRRILSLVENLVMPLMAGFVPFLGVLVVLAIMGIGWDFMVSNPWNFKRYCGISAVPLSNLVDTFATIIKAMHRRLKEADEQKLGTSETKTPVRVHDRIEGGVTIWPKLEKPSNIVDDSDLV